MPNISDFNAGNITIRPSETGVEATANAARRIGVAYNEVGHDIAAAGARIGQSVREAGDSALNYISHKQIAEGSATGMRLFSDLEESRQAAIKNIPLDDPLYGQKVETAIKDWRENGLEQRLNDWRNSGVFSTEKSSEWAENFVERTRAHMVTQSQADLATAAGIGVHNATKATLNEATNAALNDPSSVDAIAGHVKETVSGLIATSPVKGVEAARIQTEVLEQGLKRIYHAGAIGVASNSGDPEAAVKSYVNKHSEYLSGEDEIQYAKVAKAYQRMNASEARQARVQEDYIHKQDFNNAADKLEVSTLPTEAGQPPNLPKNYWDQVREIAKMPGVDPARLRALITNGNTLTDKLGKTEPPESLSHATTIDLLQRMRSGDVKDMNPIYQAYGDNKLKNADFDFISKQFQEMKTPEGERLDKDRELFFKRYSMMIDPTMGEHGDRLYTAEMDARRAEADLDRKSVV